MVDHGDTPFNLRPGAAPAATVGRTRELDLIEQLLAQAVLSGGGGPISMSGRPGLGVTAVLREIADRANSAKWAAGFSTADADLGRTIAATVNAAVERFAARRPGASRLPELRAINDRLRAERPDEPVAVRAPLLAAAEAMLDLNGGLLLAIDDSHLLGPHAVTLADIVTDIADAGLPIVAVFGGHPAAPVGLDFVLEPLQATDIARLGAAAGVPLHPSAVAAILDLSDGTPFLVQAFAEAALLAAPELPLGAEDVDSGRANALEDVIEAWYRPRTSALTGSEHRYLRAVADLGAGSVFLRDIAHRLGDTRFGGTGAHTQELTTALVRRGLLWPDGDRVSFALPSFDSYFATYC